MTNLLVIAKAVLEVVPVITALVKLYKDAKVKGWIKDGRELEQKIRTATTDDERYELARDLFERRPR